MGISTSTGTLTAGQSRTFNMSPASAVTLTLSPNVRVTITESPATVTATGLGGNATRVHEPRLPGTVTYGPYPMGGSVLVEVESNSGSSVGWVYTSAAYATDSSGAVTGLVGPDGENASTFQSPTDTTQAPYAAMTGPTQLIGSALTGTYPFLYMESFWEAIRRKSCKVLFLGDSVTENISKNWPMGHWTIELERELMRAFPDVAFEFVNISIGGKIALQVLGRTLGDSEPTSTPGSSYTAGAAETSSNFFRNAATGVASPTNPETWQGSASGVTQYANGDTWIGRIASHNFDAMTLCFGLNEENSASNYWFASSIQAIIDNVRTHSTFNGFTRPSIICATPYNDTVDRPLRNRLAEQMFALAQKNGCPVIDANRWDGIAVEGVDRYRQRWYGESMWRYLVTNKNANDLVADRATYWDITGTGTLNTGAGGTTTDYISTGNSGSVKMLRKKLSRDVQIMGTFNSASSGTATDGVVSLWYRVDPTNTAIGYELKYQGSGTLSLIYHDGTNDYTVYSKSVYALTSNTEAFAVYVRAVGAVHECWTVFGNTAPATGYDQKSMQLQFRHIHTGGESGAPCKSDIFKDGWSGIQINSIGATFPAIRAGNYSTTSGMLQFGYPLMVNQLARVDEFDMNGRVSLHMNYQPDPDIIYDGDNRGGNVINHLATDAYSLVYAAAIGSVVRQIMSSRQDSKVVRASGVQVTAPADTAENILATILIPAGTMGKNGTLDVQCLFSFTGSTNSKTAAVKFGPTLGGASLMTSVTTATAANLAANFWTMFANRNDYKKQSRIVNQGLSVITLAPTEVTVDTTVDNYVYLTGTKATGAESMVLERYVVRLVGG